MKPIVLRKIGAAEEVVVGGEVLGRIERVATGTWTYTNVIGRVGQIDNRTAALAMLGFREVR